ncbi:MAG: hypothetical protein OXR82_19910 [Gammaproteobacteria bacterium]|nr:hypothetical protein [Gammaproteobacteria bacterium]MDE0260639.1 hypothetical protein [Gammaproteobacteria bacterium]
MRKTRSTRWTIPTLLLVWGCTDGPATVAAPVASSASVGVEELPAASITGASITVSDSTPAVGDTLTLTATAAGTFDSLFTWWGTTGAGAFAGTGSGHATYVPVAADAGATVVFGSVVVVFGDSTTARAGTAAGRAPTTTVRVGELAPPMVADTIPTHDVVVDSMLALDVSPYFGGGGFTYEASTSDEAVAVVSVDGSTVTTTGVGAAEDSISVAWLSVTASNGSSESATQDSIRVRVHLEPYDTAPGITVTEDGNLVVDLGGTTLTIGICLRANNLAGYTVHWSEWQRAVSGGWLTVQDNEKVNTLPGEGNSICHIRIADDRFPPGTYRLVGHVQSGEEIGFYQTPSIEKKAAGG